MALSRIEKMSHYGVVIIALSALIVSVWQMSSLEEHNKLSVRPLLDFHIYTNDSIRSISFSNEGLGPAIIKKMNFSKDGKSFGRAYDLLKDMGQLKDISASYNYSKNSVVSPGANKLILGVRDFKHKGVEVEIVYESIYKEKFFLDFTF
ncbi:MAG: hypothetical protein R8P61_06510 [Bacteroidia bacterium]|nr:hypothetical protein [Bacteroidia bacterium]